MRELFGMMLPKQPTSFGSPVKLGREVAPAPRGGSCDAFSACDGRFACSIRVRPGREGGSGMAIFVFYTITCES